MDKRVRTRAAIKGHLTRSIKFVSGLTERDCPYQVAARYELFKELYKKFEKNQSEIELESKDEDLNVDDTERARFEEEYCAVDAKFRMWLDAFATPVGRTGTPVRDLNPTIVTEPRETGFPFGDVVGHCKLPPISLPSFSGQLTEWQEFIQIFESLIDRNEKLTPLNKLYYLKSSLKGEALKVLGSLAVTGENYKEGMALLKTRYDNKRCLIQTHLGELFNQPEVKTKSLVSLRTLIDDTNRHIASLRSLGEDVDSWDTVLSYVLVSRLDLDSRRGFELEFATDTPTYQQTLEFLNRRCMALERVDSLKVGKTSPRVLTASLRPSKIDGFKEGSTKCSFCKSTEHKVYSCSKFLALGPKERFQMAKSSNLCLNCLGSYHRANECRSKPCFKCKLKHNTLLHFELSSSSPSEKSSTSELRNNSEATKEVVGLQSISTISTGSSVLLYTSRVKIRDIRGRLWECRALLDTGAQMSFISRSFLSRLGLVTNSIECKIEGLGTAKSPVDECVDLVLRSNVKHFELSVRTLVLEKIVSDLPQRSLQSDVGNTFLGLNLADPDWNRSGPIDILLSNAVFAKILKEGIHRDQRTGLLALNTHFGWVIGGGIKDAESVSLSGFGLCAVENLAENVQKFWELDEATMIAQTADDPCEDHFKRTVKRSTDGRFIVKLPIAEGVPFDFSSSKVLALNRFRQLERRFSRDCVFKALYLNHVNECVQGNIFERVPNEDFVGRKKHYLPHHGVLKLDSSTMKLRCVFDGSAASADSISLNAVLHTGRKLQTDLIKVLLRFRTFPIAFVADVQKMFCQILIDPEDRDYLRFFWRSDTSEPIAEFRHCRLPFGLTCSPFIAINCIRNLADGFTETEPAASRLLIDNMYVDDLIGGSYSIESAKKSIVDVQRICGSGGFHLRKWVCNDEDVLSSLSIEYGSEFVSVVADDLSVLGIRWIPKKDLLSLKIEFVERSGNTKRLVLSQLAKLFDPFGWLGPLVAKGKILIQELWAAKIGWDELIPKSKAEEWEKIVGNLTILNDIQIERFIDLGADSYICCFVDASVKAFGACVYIVSKGRVRLLMSKSRVAPLKVVSLARLELCAACIGAKLTKFVADTLDMPQSRCFIWSDSKIVLSWLRRPAYVWKTFVANRVSSITNCIPHVQWAHVSSKENPADLLSRGSYPSQLKQAKIWWSGPEWLSRFDGAFTKPDIGETDLEIKAVLVAVNCNSVLDVVLEKSSSFMKILRIIAWINRFVSNCMHKNDEQRSNLLNEGEIEKALHQVIRRLQNKHFGQSVSRLTDGKALDRNDALVSLCPFIDESGIIRVGGRLKNSFLPFDSKHPMILPKKDRFVDALIRFEHFRHHHMGCNFLIGLTRRRFWIVNARTTITKVIRRCIVCFRHRPSRSDQFMGELPLERTQFVRPFDVTGVDLCGPFWIRPYRGRGRITFKGYVALFVCFAIKAVHLEVVTDLSTSVFVAALSRFIGRRGRPSVFYSDNGTNFVGTRNQLEEWYRLLNSDKFRSDVNLELSKDRIVWKFTPPKGPWFGGLWESHIKIFKNCLLKSMGNEKLTLEEFNTLIIEIESSMNSRPLCRLSENSDDLDALTPGHFLTGIQLRGLPEMESNNPNLRSRWLHLRQIFSHYWSRWRDEYLSSMQFRYKNRYTLDNVRVGDVGILMKENYPAYVWPLCRIIETVKGRDGLVRVVIVRTKDSILKRPVRSFCPFPDFNGMKSAGSMEKELPNRK